MKDKIFLEELPKSNSFIENVNIADELTKKTKLEHGFRFCKEKHKLIIDKICSGEKCEMDIPSEKCNKHDNIFHTHPDRLSSVHSPADLSNLALLSSITNEPRISCVKSERDNFMECLKINPPNEENAIGIYLLTKNYYDNPKKENRHKLEETFIETIKPDKIIIHSKTGKVKGHYKSKKYVHFWH